MKNFLSFVEIQTKPATLIPFVVALAYVFYSTGRISIRSTLAYIPAALLVDMAITAINNAINRREERKRPHYGRVASVAIIAAMLLASAALGLYLVSIHGAVLLAAGALCFIVGIGYTFGPMPISKTCFGEVFAGFIAGFVIMFIGVYINDPLFAPVALDFGPASQMVVRIDMLDVLLFGIITAPAVLVTANILLANNICDEHEDRAYRYTLVHSIGKKRSLWLFAVLYALAYCAIILSVIMRQLPPTALLALLTAFPVFANVRRFFAAQTKSQTFVLSVKNMMMLLLAYAVGIAIWRLF